MSWLLVAPIVIPLAAAVVGFAGRGSGRTQRAVSLAGALGLSAAAAGLLASVWREGIASVQIGRWPAPYGITLVADHLSAAMVAVTALIGLATVVYAFGAAAHVDSRDGASVKKEDRTSGRTFVVLGESDTQAGKVELET